MEGKWFLEGAEDGVAACEAIEGRVVPAHITGIHLRYGIPLVAGEAVQVINRFLNFGGEGIAKGIIGVHVDNIGGGIGHGIASWIGVLEFQRAISISR